jgi:hypothetical protein
MEDWEFLIQREGDRGWRPIKTGNIQLMEGKYRIVANSNLPQTQIRTQISHQLSGATPAQIKSQTCEHTSNAKGLVVIIPYTNLRSGLWEFVCSATAPDPADWVETLQLKILPHSETISPVPPSSSIVSANLPTPVTTETVPSSNVISSTAANNETSSVAPTNVIVTPDLSTPVKAELAVIPSAGKFTQLNNTLDRLLEQLERDAVQIQESSAIAILPRLLRINSLDLAPQRLIRLDRSTFAEIDPGSQLTVKGACNLKLIDHRLTHKPIVSSLSICLRHSQTAEIVAQIEAKVPPTDRFAFDGELELPTESTTNLLIGEVNLYDLDNTQLGSRCFTVTLAVNPRPKINLSFLKLLEADLQHATDPQSIARWHEIAETTSAQPDPSLGSSDSTLQYGGEQTRTRSNPTEYPSVPIAYRRESLFSSPPDRNDRPESKSPPSLQPITAHWESNFDDSISDRQDSLEVVIDD